MCQHRFRRLLSNECRYFSSRGFTAFFILLASLALSACGGGGGGSAPISDPTSTSISGGGVKGPLANAIVTVYSFDASQTGFKSATPVATASTNSNAAITGLSLPFPVTPPYLMEFTSDAGTIDITTGKFPVITTLRTVITQSLLDGSEQIYATPLTTMAVDIAVSNAVDTNATVGIQADEFEAALAVAASHVVSTLGFGLDGSVDIFDTPPLVDNTTDTAEEQANVAAYRAAVEAVTAVAYQISQQSTGGDTDGVLAELAADLADGDGINGSAGTLINTNTLQVLEQDPSTLVIPNTETLADPDGQTVAEVQAILVTEAAVTAPATPVAELDAGGSITTVPVTAETNPDIDADGVLNTEDAYPTDATADTDTDGDGAPDVAYTDSTRSTIDAARSDADDDNDGWLDTEDDYPVDATRSLDPTLDRDTDTIANGIDNCPLDPNTNQNDTDGDGVGDACSNDNDGDGVVNLDDNCPAISNPSQIDTDGDLKGDVCDPDIDEDGVLNAADAFPLDPTEQLDTDNDGIGNETDTDDDNDGVNDAADTGTGVGGIACSLLADCDGDGVLDNADFDPLDPLVTFNFAPVTGNSSVTTDEDVAIPFVLTVTDDGVAAGPLVFNITGPSSGVLSGTEPDLTYTPAAEFNGSDSFTFTATDDDGKVSNVSTVNITVNAVNDNPVANADTETTDEDTAVTTVDVTVNDSDIDGDVITATLLANAGNGNVIDNGDNTFTYTPNANFNGADSFTYTLSDNNGGSATGTVNITVNTINDNPVANADAVSTNEDAVVTTGDVTANDTDVDAGAVLSVVAGNPLATNGTVVNNNDGTFTYTPNADFNGTDSFTYTLSDGTTGTATGTVTVTVIPVNDNPVANADTVITDEDTAVTTVDVTVNDSDIDGDTVTATLLANAANGNVVDNGDNTFTYTPNADLNGADSFTYTLSDGNGGSATGTVNIAVNAVNDGPVANADVETTNEDTVVITADVRLNDTDSENDALTAILLANASNGNVVDNSGGIFTYTPNADFNGDDSFTYTLSDGNGGSATGTVNIVVTAVNDDPVGNVDAFSAGVATPTVLDVLANDTDVDLDALSITAVTQGSRGSVVSTDGTTVTFTDGFGAGTETFTYDLFDGTTTVAGITVTMTITANIPPVANSDSTTTDEDTPVTTVDVLANDTDGGDGPGALSITSADTVSINGGSVLNNGDGTFTYTPVADFNGADSFTYTVSDTQGTSVGTVNITVNAVNDAPFANDDLVDTTAEDTPLTTANVLINDTDTENDLLSVFSSDISSIAGGVVSDNADGTFTYTPPTDFNGQDSFGYTVTDGFLESSAIVYVDVTPVNDAPVAGDDSETTVVNTSVTTVDVLVNDSDVEGDELSVIAGNPTATNGTVVNNNNGTFSYTPDTDYIGSDSFTYTVSDGSLTSVGTVNITVNPAGTPIDMSVLMDVTNGGVAGVEMGGPNDFQYWTDSYDSVNSVFVFEDKTYNYATGVFDTVVEGDDLLLDGSNWVARGDIDGAFNGSALDLTISNQADTATLASYKLTARYIDISGELIIDRLEDVEWQNAMVDPTAVFGADARLVTEYNFEALSDSYWLWADDWCKNDGTSKYGDLNGNCNAVDVDVSVNSTGYAQLLSETIVATAWVDPDDYSTPPGAIQVAWNDANNNVLMVQLVSDGTANYYVVDWNSADGASRVADAVPGTNWVQDSSSGVEMIQYLIPDTLVAQFPNDLNEGLNFFLTVHDGFVRKGSKSLTGDIDSEGGHLNGAALNDVLANFDAVQAIGYNYTDITAQPIYDLYYDAAVPTWCIDSYNFYGNGSYDGYDYVVCSGSASGWSGTYSINATTGVMTIVDGIDTFYKKVIGFNSNYGAKETCGSLNEAGPFNCVEGDEFFGYEFTDPTAAENAMNVLNTPAPANPFPDAATLAGTTQYVVSYCDDCVPEGWILEPLEFDVDGSTYTLDSTEVGSYSVTNGILFIDAGSFSEYIQIMSVDPATGANRTCWQATLAELSNCTELGYDFHFDNPTDAQNFLDNQTFTTGVAADATTLLAGGIYEFWDSWDGTQSVPGYWNLSVNGPTIIDRDSRWSVALNKFLPDVRNNASVMLTSSGWQLGTDDIADVVFSGNQATFNIRAPDNEVVQTWVATYEAIDITGREIGLYAPVDMFADPSAVFTGGAQWIKETGTPDLDFTEINVWDDCGEPNYSDWGNNCNVVWRRQMTGTDVAVPLTPAADLSFIDVAGATIELGQHNNSGPNGTSLLGVFSGTTISYWTVNWDVGTTAVDTGVTGSFTLSTNVNGVTGLDIIDYTVPTTIPNYDQFNLHYDVEDGETGVLAVHGDLAIPSTLLLRYGDKDTSGISSSYLNLNSVAANDIFNNMPAAPAVYGTWVPSDYSDLTTAPNVITFFADNNYMHSGTCDDPALPTLVTGGLLGPEAGITGAAPELGPYSWDATTGDFTVNPLVDANYWCGLNDTSNGNNSGTATVTGDVMTVTNLDGSFTLDRVIPATSPIVGSWVLDDPNDPVVFTFFEDGRYNESQTCYDHETTTDGVNYTPEPIEGGIEYGTYNWSDPDLGGNGLLTGDVIIDTDGWCGIHDTNDSPATAAGGMTVTIDGDVMSVIIPDEPDVTLYRIQ